LYHIKRALSLIRYKEWATSKLLFHLVVILLISDSGYYPINGFLALTSIICLAIFGYTVNEFADRELDTASGKMNHSIGIPNSIIIFLLITCAVLALSLCIFWAKMIYGVVFIGLGLFAAAIYSLKPTRLKTRGLAGIVTGSLAQWVIPVIALGAISDRFRSVNILLILLSLFIGIRWMCVHQLLDKDNDEIGKANTYAVKTGIDNIRRLILFSFAIELICLFGIIVSRTHLKIAVLISLIVWFIQQLAFTPQRLKLGKLLFCYRRSPLSNYYFLLLPVALLLQKSLYNVLWVVLFPVCLISGWCYVQMMTGDFYDSIEATNKTKPVG